MQRRYGRTRYVIGAEWISATYRALVHNRLSAIIYCDVYCPRQRRYDQFPIRRLMTTPSVPTQAGRTVDADLVGATARFEVAAVPELIGASRTNGL